MAANKQIVLITGGNGGIGFELASQLLADSSKHILLGSRSVEKGQAAVKDLESRNLPGTVELLQVDVTSEDSINTAAKNVESKHGRLDALVNNAAVAMPPGNLSLAKQMAICYETNVIGVELMGLAFAPLLEKAIGTPYIINVSSGQGSIAFRLDPSYSGYQVRGIQYRASKAGLNMVTADQVFEYGNKGFKIFSYCPGFTVSNLSHMNISQNGAKPTSAGAAPMVNILNGARDADHGCFINEEGRYPW